MSEKRQIEYIGFRDGIIRVVHDTPLETYESYVQASHTTLVHLAANDNYRLYAKDPQNVSLPTAVWPYEPDDEKIKNDEILASGDARAVLGTIAYLGTSLQ